MNRIRAIARQLQIRRTSLVSVRYLTQTPKLLKSSPSRSLLKKQDSEEPSS